MICPCPTKRRFYTKAEAKKWLHAHPERSEQKAYRCVCESWHLTTHRIPANEREGIKVRAERIILNRQFSRFIKQKK